MIINKPSNYCVQMAFIDCFLIAFIEKNECHQKAIKEAIRKQSKKPSGNNLEKPSKSLTEAIQKQ